MSIGKIVEAKGTAVAEFTFKIMLVTLMACATLWGQDVDYGLPVVHVQGTIRTYDRSPVPGAEVTFKGDAITMIVSTNEKGFYKTVLPVGFYSMTVDPLKRGFKEYRRPLFRVASSTSLTLDAFLYVGVSCDLVVAEGSNHTATQDETQDACGGLDFFAAPSGDGDQFQLFIDYPSRQRTDRETVYRSRISQGFKTPVLVAYNLFTLQADEVVYDVQSRILRATGNVVATNADGIARGADSMTFKIENGQATPLP